MYEEAMATHSSILAKRIPRAEEPGRLQSTGSQRVGHNWSDWACIHPYAYIPSFPTNKSCIFSRSYETSQKLDMLLAKKNNIKRFQASMSHRSSAIKLKIHKIIVFLKLHMSGNQKKKKKYHERTFGSKSKSERKVIKNIEPYGKESFVV